MENINELLSEGSNDLSIYEDIQLKKVLRFNNFYDNIYVENITLNINEINNLLKLTKVNLRIYKCNINDFTEINSNEKDYISINSCSLEFSYCKFEFRYNIFKFKSEIYTLPILKFIGCNFDNVTVIIKHNSFFGLLKFTECMDFSLVSETSNINMLATISSKANHVLLQSSNITIFKSEESEYCLECRHTNIFIPRFDKHLTEIIYDTNCSSTLKGGVLGRTLNFDIIGYKKVRLDVTMDVILELKILKGSNIYISNLSGKSRTNEVITTKIMDLEGNDISERYKDKIMYPLMYSNTNVHYKLNEVTKSDSFNNALNECTNGIHFFFNKEDAINY